MIQCFVKHAYEPVFTGENQPRLLYVSRIDPAKSIYPRVMHSHKDFVELILVRSGVSKYFIGDRQQYVCAGDLIVYNSGVLHDEAIWSEHKLSIYCLAVGGLALPGLRRDALIPDNAQPVYSCEACLPVLERLCEMMFDALRAGTCQSEKFAQLLMESFLVKILPVLTGAGPEEDSEEERVLGARIRKYLDEHYMDAVDLSYAAEALNMSMHYMSHVFKRVFGYSPMNYLLRRRIGEAQTLLITTDLSITEIGERVGYETTSYFSTQFTKQVGMSPKKYRKTYVVRQDGP
ncbi:MAG: AraC family transcriptional regulator [Clostridiaceae bacterium]|nr:AraC family transcriptional regulator [Clostridiaceae bacterium]MCI9483313.1 AraC family transcriptional regulator [Clostridiaceae bacterium]NBH78495.1 AraC family transcriptional regulator [Clostridiaceae bacterium]NBI83760.1 AraC family transcriptional regulator [Clostridiaceae bacterium]